MKLDKGLYLVSNLGERIGFVDVREAQYGMRYARFEEHETHPVEYLPANYTYRGPLVPLPDREAVAKWLRQRFNGMYYGAESPAATWIKASECDADALLAFLKGEQG